MVVRFLVAVREWSGLINVIWHAGTAASLLAVLPLTYLFALQAGYGCGAAALLGIPTTIALFVIEALFGWYVLSPFLDATMEIRGGAVLCNTEDELF